MAISSYKVFLMGLYTPSEGQTGVWKKIIDIKDFPDLIEPPEQLETTTLSNRNHTYIPGIQQSSDKTFTCNYTADDYAKVAGLKDHLYGYAVWFGGTEDSTTHAVTPTGSEGKFAFAGYLTPSVSGAGVNEVVNMTLTITPATDIRDDGTIDWGSFTETLIPSDDTMGTLTVGSAAGSAVGATAITVTGNSLASGQKYVYKFDTTAPEIAYNEAADYTWTQWDGSAQINVGTAANGKEITIAVLNSTGNAIKSGSATLVVKIS